MNNTIRHCPSGTYPTVATARQHIDSSPDLSESRRRDLKAMLNAVVKFTGKQPQSIRTKSSGALPETLRLDPAEMSRGFLAATPAAVGIKPSSLATYKTGLCTLMRRLNLLDRPRLTATPLPPAWASLWDGYSDDKYLPIRLQGFIGFCIELSLVPEQVTDDVLNAYLEHLRTHRLIRSPTTRISRIVAAWNRAVELVPGWPQHRLQSAASTRIYSKPLKACSKELQTEVAVFEASMLGNPEEGLYSSSPQRALLRPNTIKTYLVCLRLAIAALVHSGTDIASITSLADLVKPENLKTILDWHYKRIPKEKRRVPGSNNYVIVNPKPNMHTGTIATTLQVIAKYHVGLTGPDLEEVMAITRRAKPKKRSKMTEKNENRLQVLEDANNLARLLHLPEHLMRQAKNLVDTKRQYEAIWLAGVAVAIEIELRCPMRLHNLAHLRIGENIVKLDSRGSRFTHFRITADEVKNEEAITWPINPETAGMIETYIRDYRCHLATADTNWLFPNRDHTDEPRKPAGLSFAISDAIWRHVGIQVNTHLFRAFAGVLILDDNPGAIEDLRLILGHKTLATALAYYASHRPKNAARSLDQVVTRRKIETRLTAATAFARQTATSQRRRSL